MPREDAAVAATPDTGSVACELRSIPAAIKTGVPTLIVVEVMAVVAWDTVALNTNDSVLGDEGGDMILMGGTGFAPGGVAP